VIAACFPYHSPFYNFYPVDLKPHPDIVYDQSSGKTGILSPSLTPVPFGIIARAFAMPMADNIPPFQSCSVRRCIPRLPSPASTTVKVIGIFEGRHPLPRFHYRMFDITLAIILNIEGLTSIQN
jgi:hypothetical protein